MIKMHVRRKYGVVLVWYGVITAETTRNSG